VHHPHALVVAIYTWDCQRARFQRCDRLRWTTSRESRCMYARRCRRSHRRGHCEPASVRIFGEDPTNEKGRRADHSITALAVGDPVDKKADNVRDRNRPSSAVRRLVDRRPLTKRNGQSSARSPPCNWHKAIRCRHPVRHNGNGRSQRPTAIRSRQIAFHMSAAANIHEIVAEGRQEAVFRTLA
jgi:hypothetical protein